MAKIVYVGSARSDENGGAHGGRAGDQRSGREVSAQPWYRHGKGWRVFRAKNPAHAAKIAGIMRWACESELIGYDQWNRHSLYKELEKGGFRDMNLTKAVETDCSALVRVCLAFCGVDVPEEFRTGNMPGHLLGSGAFTEMKGSRYTDQPDFLGAGDILVTKTSGHTVVALDSGDQYEETDADEPAASGADVLRRGDKGAAVRQMQTSLDKLGYDLGGAGVDGDFGPATEAALKAFQRDRGLTVDGCFGAESCAAMTAAIGSGTAEVRAGSWRVRTGPGTDYPTAGFVSGGDRLAKVDPDGWQPVLYGGEVRFISAAALSEVSGHVG